MDRAHFTAPFIRDLRMLLEQLSRCRDIAALDRFM
jgi:hypothetical protein